MSQNNILGCLHSGLRWCCSLIKKTRCLHHFFHGIPFQWEVFKNTIHNIQEISGYLTPCIFYHNQMWSSILIEILWQHRNEKLTINDLQRHFSTCTLNKPFWLIPDEKFKIKISISKPRVGISIIILIIEILYSNRNNEINSLYTTN